MGIAAHPGRGREEAGDEQERVAGEGRREQARLDEDDREEADRPEGLDEMLRLDEVEEAQHGRSR